MKNFTSILLFIMLAAFSVQAQSQMNLPVTFDEPDVNYGIVGFGGADDSAIVDDPTDASNKVARVIKSVDAELWAGATVTAVTGGVQTGFASRIPFTASQTRMTVRVWSPDAGIPVRLKVEDHLDPTKSVETEATTSVANEWQTLTFNFANQAPGTEALNLSHNFNKASIFFNFGVTGAEAGVKTYYFDDMAFIAEDGDGGNGNGGNGDGSGIVFPVTFEEDLSWNELITNFDGGELTVVDNPDTNGNTSAKVARMVKNTGQPWGGAFILMDQNIDFSAGTDFTVSVWAPRADTKMLFKFENETDGAQAYEREVTIPESSQWTDVTIGMSGASREFTYKKVVLIFDLGTVGDGSADFTWYVDNIRQLQGDGNEGGSGDNPLNLPVTFDADIDYGLTDFGGNESEIVVDPTDATNKVAMSMKAEGAETWAGTTVGGTAGFARPIPFANGDTKMSLRVWSPVAGIPVRLKVEASNDPTISVETEATVTTASQWQTLTFDFANQAAGTEAINFSRNYNKASVFFNFGSAGTGQTYYWDDMAFGVDEDGDDDGDVDGEVGENIIINGDFADGLNSWTPFIADFAGVSANVAASEGEASITNIAGAGGEIWHVQFNQIFTSAQIGALEVGQNYIAKFDARSSVEGRALRLYFGEDGGGFASVSVTDHTINTEIQTIEVPFIMSNTYGAMKFGFEMGLSNDPVFIRNVSLIKGGDGGNGGVDDGDLILPVTFENDDLDYGLTDFGGNVSEIVVDPTDAGNKVASTVKTEGSEVWAGTTVGGTTGFASPIPFASGATTVSLRVWSPAAGIPVRLKVEDSNDPAISVETEATVTTASQWQTLSFDFANQAAGTEAINFSRNYNKASVFFNFGTAGTGETYYWDDMAFGSDDDGDGDGDGEVGENIIINGDFADGLSSWTPFIADFAGVSATVAASEGEASISNIAGAGGEIWHVQFNQIFTSAQIGALEVGQNYIAKFDARSSVEGRGLRLYFGEDGGGFASVSVTDHTINTEIQTIEVPFTMSNTYGAMKFGFEMGLSNDPVFIRNVSLVKVGGGNGGGGDTNLELPVTFENEDLDYGLTDFGGNDSEIVVDPTNAGNKVAKSVKTAEAELWAGTTVGGTTGFASPIPFASGDTKMSMRVWSPTSGIPIRLKVEDSNDPTISVETEATVTVAGQWQTLTFDFANQAAGTEAINFSRNYNKASVFFNFGITGAEAGEQTYYWDDMAFGEIVQVEQVISFPAIGDKTLGEPPFDLNATSTSGLAISYSSDNDNVSISGPIATLVNPGRTTITASQPGNIGFFPADPVSQSFCINPIRPIINVTGQGTEEVTLTSSSPSGNQWFLNGEIIPDATGSTIAISTFGTYTVQVTIDDCISEISEEVTLIVNSVRAQQFRELNAFPNPVENTLHLRGLNGPIGYSDMVDMAGRPTSIVFSELDNEYQADVSRLSPGVYLLRVQQGNRNYSLKIIKK